MASRAARPPFYSRALSRTRSALESAVAKDVAIRVRQLKALRQISQIAADAASGCRERRIGSNSVQCCLVRLREMLAFNTGLARQFAQLEARLDKRLADHDEAIAAILSAIRQLMNPPSPRRRPIGFTADLGDKK